MVWRGPWPSAHDDGEGHPQDCHHLQFLQDDITDTARGSIPENSGCVRVGRGEEQKEHAQAMCGEQLEQSPGK